MILLCSGQITERAFDALLLFASELDKSGHKVAIDARFKPEIVQKHQKFEAAPFLADHSDLTASKVVMIGAETISGDVQLLLRNLALAPEVPVWAVGHFTDRQDEINASNKIAYCLGREPDIIDLAAPHKTPLLEGTQTPLVTTITPEPMQETGRIARLLMYLPLEALENPETLPELVALNHHAQIELHIITNGQGKALIRQSNHSALSVFGYGELQPTTLVDYADILVFFGKNIPGERMALLALNAMGAGKVVIDATSTDAFTERGAPVLNGPEDLNGLTNYLEGMVLQNRAEIGRRIQKSDWLKDFDIAKLTLDLGLGDPAPREPDHPPQTLFFPTNGNGLGHAQRCSLIAEAMSKKSARSFAAFPSCIEMIRNRGFSCAPMVSRSDDHSEPYANDLVNYLRLHGILRSRDQLVFDGGYVFDSVYRTISALRLPAVWIRRGLWQQGQIHPTALERERVFSKVIIPSEAFPELNAAYSFGERIHAVGPIVNKLKRSKSASETLRKKLSTQFKRPIDSLVVTMLGGGVASERTAQTQMMCSILEQRKNCLHLVVAWPNAVVSNGLYGWENTRVIHTQHTQELCQAADLTVSAVGYNSFHEIMYSQIPAILIPQSAPYLDDQEKRARAASERGLAALILETELLQLEREVTAFLDDGKADEIRAAMQAETLPEPGNIAAAALIEEGLK